MSDPNIITARTSPEGGGPPPDLGQYASMRWAVKHPPADPTVSFAGKTVLVTGANTGIGFEAAVKYSALGADLLILGVRSAEKGEDTKKRILDRTHRQSDTIAIAAVDLATFASVRDFVATVEKLTPRLDVALLNAGLGNPKFEAAPSGWEMGLQVNVLSTTLMAILLLPLLRRTASATGNRPHLTFTNSHGHGMVKREWFAKSGSLFKAVAERDNWNPDKSYLMLKLIGCAVAEALSAVTRGKASNPPEIILNLACPALCKTDLGRKFSVASHIFMAPFLAIFARTAEQGARTLVSATALGPESHAGFWTHDVLYPYGELVNDKDLMQQAWHDVLEIVKEDNPDVQRILEGGE
uniref:Short-chain dehydrogenase n=1 Tax=Chaetomium globosum TaxID=38033 RepID=A0A6B9NYV8_CHAGS|nr:short-chain dehydrogenase [Chaetomium globosum]